MKDVESLARVDIGGVGLCPLSEADVVAHVRTQWRAGRGGTIVTANVDIVRAAACDPTLADLVANASLVVADGMPLVWAARLMGKKLPKRVTGSALVFSLSEAAAADGRSIFLLGGDPGVPETAAAALQGRFQSLQVAGTATPPRGFEKTEHGMDEVVSAVVAAAPDLVLVGLGFPKQERTILRLQESLPDAWYLGCGAGIPMAAGQFRRAPVVMQRLGMEWLHRLALEPRRLARRYLRDDLPFAITLLSAALGRRVAIFWRAGQGSNVRYQPDAVAARFGGEQKSSLRLWALSTNRLRLHWEQYGQLPAVLMRLKVPLDEVLRLVGRRGSDRRWQQAAVRALFWTRRWPTSTDPGYVCFSAQDWWYHNRAHSDFQLMRNIAQHRRVLVVNSIGMRMPLPGRSTHAARRVIRKLRSVAMLVRRPIPDLPGFHVMSPLPLPFYEIPWLRRLNAVIVRAQVRMVCLVLGLRAPVIIATLPTAWDIVRPMRRRTLIYNRSDRHSEFPESDRATIESMERDLLHAADHVLYVSRLLLAEEQALVFERGHFLDHGVDVEHFYPRGANEWPVDLTEIPEPRVGFFGAFDNYLVDFDLLERVAAELPDVSLVLIGDATYPMERFDKYPNVYWLGHRSYEQIPKFGSGFAVALMPWLDNQWIRYSNPIKLKEYLALGLPVVSTGFAEVAHYTDRVRVAATGADFVAAIRATLNDGGLLTPQQRRASILGASWKARADTVIQLAEGGPRSVV